MASGATTFLSAVFRIGDDAAGARFTGLIDDVRITADALPPEQIMQADDRTETPDALVIVVR